MHPARLRIVHHDIEILDARPRADESRLPGRRRLCADEQGKYWDYAHWIYDNQDGENRAASAGRVTRSPSPPASTRAFSACLDSAGAAPSSTADHRGHRARHRLDAHDVHRRPADRRLKTAPSWDADRRRARQGQRVPAASASPPASAAPPQPRPSGPFAARSACPCSLATLAALGIAGYLAVVRVLGRRGLRPVDGCETVAASEYSAVSGSRSRSRVRVLAGRRRSPRPGGAATGGPAAAYGLLLLGRWPSPT